MDTGTGSSLQTRPTSSPQAQLDRDWDLAVKLQDALEGHEEVPVSTCSPFNGMYTA